MEPGPNSQALIDEVVDDFCPQADFVVLVPNTVSFGGCAGGNRFTVTRGAGWGVVAHEFGHGPAPSAMNTPAARPAAATAAASPARETSPATPAVRR